MAIIAGVVNGPCLIQVGLGSDYAQQNLGYSEDGVELSCKLNVEDFHNDVFGLTPFDVQHFLEEATISCTLVTYDTTVLASVLGRYYGGTAGTMPAAGTLLQAQGLMYPIIAQTTPSPNGVFGDAPCTKFLQCYLADSWTRKVGTRVTRVTLTWRCLPVQTIPSTGAYLYEFACS